MRVRGRCTVCTDASVLLHCWFVYGFECAVRVFYHSCVNAVTVADRSCVSDPMHSIAARLIFRQIEESNRAHGQPCCPVVFLSSSPRSIDRVRSQSETHRSIEQRHSIPNPISIEELQHLQQAQCRYSQLPVSFRANRTSNSTS